MADTVAWLVENAELKKRLTAAADWHVRPTCPGLWLCWGEKQNGIHGAIRASLLRLSQLDLDRGSPFFTATCFGPIPEPPDGTPVDPEKREELAQIADSESKSEVSA